MTITISNGGGAMTTIVGRNVNELWSAGVAVLNKYGRASPSRNGKVYVVPNPVMSVYLKPCERVLFDPVRNANPFFHLHECLWMIHGDHDAAFLNKFVGDFGKRFAEENGMLHGAYGYRWRHQFDVDQIKVACERLLKDYNDRRIVIAMWSPDDDCLEPDLVNDDTGKPYPEPRDLPCNTHIYLRVRQTDNIPELDLTVMCRSNDIVWGAYGANAVHFSFLQEYIASKIGVAVGRMYQLSNNWHAYDATFKMTWSPLPDNPYDDEESQRVQPYPIMADPKTWDSDLFTFFKWSKLPSEDLADFPSFHNPWFPAVACQMYMTHDCFKVLGAADAMDVAEQIEASDWRRAAQQWLQLRIDLAAAKEIANG